jgi:NAD(P)-dependent dehydrogenase (short-subunit alcohol dehydrogenase family)
VYIDENLSAFDILKNKNLKGLNAIVTGANRGIGLTITKALAFSGCNVFMACRNIEMAETERNNLLKERVNIELNLEIR